jgi:pimeloyl-ACP methyl ester carboxylesterase
MLKPIDIKTAVLHGHEVSYRVAGEGPALLLVHGIAGRADNWDPVIPALARTHTVIAPDLPGHGLSGKPSGDYSIGALASAMRDLLVYLGHDGATVVGHSLGGGVAMQFAYMFPERCDRLVLVSSGGLGQDVNFILRAAALPGADLFLTLTAGLANKLGSGVGRAFGAVGFRPAPDVAEVARGFASLADRETRLAFLSTLRSVIGTDGQRVDASNRLYLAADMPTLIMWGELDPIIPAFHGERAHAAMPGSRLKIFAGAGHMPHIDHPNEFIHTLLEFIEQTEASDITAERWGEILRTGGRPPVALAKAG